MIDDARRIAGEPEGSTYVPDDPKEFAGRIFHTCFMGTENSSAATRDRAKELAKDIGRLIFSVFSFGVFRTESELTGLGLKVTTWTSTWTPSSALSRASSD